MVKREVAPESMGNLEHAEMIANQYGCSIAVAKASLVQKTILEGDYEGLAFWSKGVTERAVDNIPALVNIFESTDRRFRFVDEPSQQLCQSLQELEKASAKNTGRGY